MNKKLLIGVFFSLFFFKQSNGYAQSKDTTAFRIVEENIKVVELCIKTSNSDSSRSWVKSVYFLINLTGIPSSSGGGYIGPAHPNKADLNYWRNWYLENKENISWDEQEKKVVYINKVRPPGW